MELPVLLLLSLKLRNTLFFANIILTHELGGGERGYYLLRYLLGKRGSRPQSCNKLGEENTCMVG